MASNEFCKIIFKYKATISNFLIYKCRENVKFHFQCCLDVKFIWFLQKFTIVINAEWNGRYKDMRNLNHFSIWSIVSQGEIINFANI